MENTIWYSLLSLMPYIPNDFLLLGDVNFVKIFSQPLVVLNSFAAAKDLLVERGAIYSGRPRLVLIAEM